MQVDTLRRKVADAQGMADVAEERVHSTSCLDRVLIGKLKAKSSIHKSENQTFSYLKSNILIIENILSKFVKKSKIGCLL